MKLFCCALLGLGLIFHSATPANAASLSIDSTGILWGATDVEVDGIPFDVQFIEGTCETAFDGCDSLADFGFSTFASATLASQALLDQVFVGAYSSTPEDIFGCIDRRACVVMTPWDLEDTFLWVSTANVFPTVVNSESLGSYLRFGSSTSTFDNRTWARWSQVSAVPLPAALPFMAAGLAGLGVLGWARTRTPPGA